MVGSPHWPQGLATIFSPLVLLKTRVLGGGNRNKPLWVAYWHYKKSKITDWLWLTGWLLINVRFFGQVGYCIRLTQLVNHTIGRVVLLGRQTMYYFYTPGFLRESLSVHYHSQQITDLFIHRSSLDCYRHGMCFRASSVFVVSILFWFPQRTHYFWRVFRFLFMEHKQYQSWHL
jgi:hypothetical protein